MRDAVPQTIQLKDYVPPAFDISRVALDVDIRENLATVRATLQVKRNRGGEPLVLDGEDLELVAVRIDGKALSNRSSIAARRACCSRLRDRPQGVRRRRRRGMQP